MNDPDNLHGVSNDAVQYKIGANGHPSDLIEFRVIGVAEAICGQSTARGAQLCDKAQRPSRTVGGDIIADVHQIPLGRRREDDTHQSLFIA